LALLLGLPDARCQAAGVAVSLHLDADSVEIIRGLRRANGIDPPDSAADLRLAEILAKARNRQRGTAEASRFPAKVPSASAGKALPREAIPRGCARVESAPSWVGVERGSGPGEASVLPARLVEATLLRDAPCPPRYEAW
jgi:hypothetical protein